MTWEIKEKKVILNTHPFVLEEITLSKNGLIINHPYTRISPPDWVNILPITKNKEVILIEQYRVGSNQIELEIPGGVVDPGEEENLSFAAKRELEEETGYITKVPLIHIGSINPNPAIQNNKVHFYIADQCEIPKQRNHFPDSNEDITIKYVPLDQIESIVREGKMNHCLAAQCILMAVPFINEKLK